MAVFYRLPRAYQQEHPPKTDPNMKLISNHDDWGYPKCLGEHPHVHTQKDGYVLLVNHGLQVFGCADYGQSHMAVTATGAPKWRCGKGKDQISARLK